MRKIPALVAIGVASFFSSLAFLLMPFWKRRSVAQNFLSVFEQWNEEAPVKEPPNDVNNPISSSNEKIIKL